MRRIDQVKERIAPIRYQLLEHRLYQAIKTVEHLRIFAEHHVFAVWDFMSLLKSLQNRLCCNHVPWMPSRFPAASHLINEIVRDEESDVRPDGSVLSHFEMYSQAVKAFGANLDTMEHFSELIRDGVAVHEALDRASVPAPQAHFVTSTFEVIQFGDTCCIASAFTFGREDLLPDVFMQLVDELNDTGNGELGLFHYYLQRHIALDGEDHGHRAIALIEEVCGDDHRAWRATEAAAKFALRSRLHLWDAILARIDSADSNTGISSAIYQHEHKLNSQSRDQAHLS